MLLPSRQNLASSAYAMALAHLYSTARLSLAVHSSSGAVSEKMPSAIAEQLRILIQGWAHQPLSPHFKERKQKGQPAGALRGLKWRVGDAMFSSELAAPLRSLSLGLAWRESWSQFTVPGEPSALQHQSFGPVVVKCRSAVVFDFLPGLQLASICSPESTVVKRQFRRRARGQLEKFIGNCARTVLSEAATLQEMGAARSKPGAGAAAPLSDQLWQRAQRQVATAVHHPFIISLAAGTLPEKIFSSRFQKASFGTSELSVLLSDSFPDSPPTISPLSTPDRNGNVSTKLMHKSDADELLAALQSLAGRVAVYRLWFTIGRALSRLDLPDRHPFRPWIETCGGEHFEAVVYGLETKLDSLAEDLVEKRRCNEDGRSASVFVGKVVLEDGIKQDGLESEIIAELEGCYSKALEDEIALLDEHSSRDIQTAVFRPFSSSSTTFLADLAHNGEAPFPMEQPVPIFVTDFDATCTFEDTSGTLVELAMASLKRRGPKERQAGHGDPRVDPEASIGIAMIGQEEVQALQALQARWQALVQLYYCQMDLLLQRILSDSSNHGSATEFGLEAEAQLVQELLSNFAAGLAAVSTTDSFLRLDGEIKIDGLANGRAREAEVAQALSDSCRAEETNAAGWEGAQDIQLGVAGSLHPTAGLDPRLERIAAGLLSPAACQVCLDVASSLPGVTPTWAPQGTGRQDSEVLASSADFPFSTSKSFNPAGLHAAFRQLAKLEEVTNRGVVASQVVKGIRREEIRSLAPENAMRPNCVEVLERVAGGGWPLHMLSANWSRDLIAGAFPSLTGPGASRSSQFYVHSNDLVFDSDGKSTGDICRMMQTAFDKARMIECLRHLTHISPALDGNQLRNPGGTFSVYLGDSVTDLLALLGADLGIVMGSSKTLRRLCRAYGVELRPLVAASVAMAAAKSEGRSWSGRGTGVVYEVTGWEDVEACLFGECRLRDNSPN